MVYILGEDNPDALSYGYHDLDGDFSQVAAIDMSRDDGITPTVGSMANVGRLVNGKHMPTKIRRDGPKRPTPDVVFHHSIPVVDEAFRAIIERVEPGAHQFFPVDVVWSDDTLAARKYFLVVGRRLDTINRRLTTMERGKFFYKPVKGSDSRLVFDVKQIGQAHLWHDKHLISKPLISDQLASAIREAGITGVNLGPHEQV